LGLQKADSVFSKLVVFANMDNHPMIRFSLLVALYTIGFLILTVWTNNWRMEFRVLGKESLDIMTSAMPFVTFLILSVEFS
jgi:uncharacterized membrane protein YidH (DUF202 family)